MHKCPPNTRTNARQNAQVGARAMHAQMHPPLGGGIVCASGSAQVQPKASDLLIAAFDVQPAGIYVERAGAAMRGQRPAWLDWPMVRCDEFAPQSPQAPKVRR